MIDRYTRPEMAALWTKQKKFETWLEVELNATDAWVKLGKVPAEAAAAMRKNAKFTVERVEEIEQSTRHDVVAFTRCVAESLGDESKYLHFGLTSTDVVDTALSSIVSQALDIIEADMHKFIDVLAAQAVKYKMTPCMGRTHGVHAEPTTLGLKFALWYAEMQRNLERMEHAHKITRVGKISGAVGTYANVDPFVEQYVCKQMRLEPSPISTQVLQRDRYAELMSVIAITGCSLEKFATEVRGLQKTELREVEEPFRVGQKGSSAMPHKRNPINCEKICGLSRVLRGYAMAAMEDVALWHERDISHSSVERIILPDATELLDYMLSLMTRILGDLFVYPENMLRSMSMSYGLPNSQHVLLTLIDKGMLRETAYDCVQRCAMRAWQEQKPFRDMLEQDETVTSHLTPAELDEYCRKADFVFNLAGVNRLENPEDMLTTGVLVEASPAGKRVKQLSLLSGGERSLTALALLFAIFTARPSPFYVMDEVEAALDDVNLTRLINAFNELRAHAQLIIITHQQRTMSIADALYGVTMRADGVTAVVSQKLER